jgi:hypothetical protein
MSYRRSSPLSEDPSNEVIEIVRNAPGVARITNEGTVVSDARGTARVTTGTARATSSSQTTPTKGARDNRAASNFAVRASDMITEGYVQQQNAVTAAQIAEQEDRKRYITYGAVAVGGFAALLIFLRRKKKGNVTP